MKIEHIRTYNKNKGDRAYCIGHVYVDGTYSHDTIEDYDRGLTKDMSLQKIKSIKQPSKTAIPTGTYTVNMDRVSPKFSKKKYYMDFCKGKVPCLDPVPGFGGILIHRGRNEYSSAGCVIVGRNKKVGEVTDDKEVFESFYNKMLEAHKKGEKITYTITRKY